MVFDHGKIVQTGSHGMLVKEAGKYHELWTAQAGYYA
jgi:ATP-binding cassette subfamily B protein